MNLSSRSLNTHTHTLTARTSLRRCSPNREGDRRGAGRGHHSPTRTYGPEGLMGGGGTDVDTAPSHGDVDSAMGDDYGSVVSYISPIYLANSQSM